MHKMRSFLRKNIWLFILLLCSLRTIGQQTWQSKYVHIDASGQLNYIPDEKGNILPDFSQVGYYHGSKPIPEIPIVKTIAPSGQDDQRAIQNAIDEVSKLSPAENGFRGTILLKKGTYRIPGNIKISASGIVLRGEGEETRLIATGKGQRNLINVNGSGSPREINNTRRKITDTYVAVGAKAFRVSSTDGLKQGDRIMVYRPGTGQWISDLKMDQIDQRDSTVKQWKADEYNLSFERAITKIEDNVITVDNPIVMGMEERYGGGAVYKYSFDTRITNVGIEDILFESEFASDTDEDHGWVAVSFNRIENGWVKNVVSRFFGYSCVSLGDQSKNITVIDSKCLDAKSQIIGGRRYSFNNDGQQNLVLNCFASEGRHDFVTGAKVRGPNVFYNCKAEHAHADAGPHHRWAMGTLYDNIITDGEINIQDRGDWGTGHGWAGANQVIWNCTAAKSVVQDPWVSAKNYAIGLKADKYNGRLKGRPDGEWEGMNKDGLNPASLYLAQLKDAKNASVSIQTATKEDPAIVKEVINVLKKQILAQAAWALKQEPVTITALPASRSAGGKHDFYSEGDYWWPDPAGADKPYIQRDGQTNPDNFTAHREAMIRFSRIVGDLASAYKITGDKKYAVQVVKHCRAWFSDTATMMNPSLLFAQAIKGKATGRGIGIIDTIHFMEVVQGLLAIEGSAILDDDARKAFKDWFEKYLQWLTTHPYGKDEMAALNNHGTCWVMQVAVFARYTGNKELIGFCKDRFKKILLPGQMAADGSFPRELSRTKPYGYSIFNLDAMATICQVLSTPTDDLWSYALEDGRTIKKAVEFLYPCLKDKRAWPYQKDVMYWDQWPVAQPSLIFAANRFSDKDWLNTWRALDHDPKENEVIRNLPVRNPLIWF